MPESPFLRTLLRAEPLGDALGTVAGDVEGKGWSVASRSSSPICSTWSRTTTWCPPAR